MRIRTLIARLTVVLVALERVKDFLLAILMKHEMDREEFGYYIVVPVNLRFPIISFIVDKVLGYSHYKHKYWLGYGHSLIMFPPSQYMKGDMLYNEIRRVCALQRMWHHRRQLQRRR